MNLSDVKIEEYDLVSPTEILNVEKEETFIDITVDEDNTFYVFLPDHKNYLLCRNCDGSHIKMLYIGIFLKYAPQIIKDGMVKQLMTPIIALKDKKTEQIKEVFFTFAEYNRWTEKHDVSKYMIDYKKGLGSWNKEEWKYLLSKYDFSFFLDTITWDDACQKTVDDWLGSDKSDVRKEMLKKFEFSWLKV